MGLRDFKPINRSIKTIVNTFNCFENGNLLDLLWRLFGFVFAYCRKSIATDLEHMATHADLTQRLPLHDMDRHDSESYICCHDVSVPMWNYPAKVSLFYCYVADPIHFFHFQEP